ncbi:MAG: hypothetical protein KDA87_27020 [Planctomycetales bacterium]|nr:hypothetical protein [Planctomycetales bacterium]
MSGFGCITTILAVPYVFGALFAGWALFLIWLGSSQGTNLSYDDARGRVGLALPTAATQIDYSKHFHQNCDVDFSIDEPGFLDWCEAQNWQITPISEEIYVDPVRPLPDAETTEILVTNGYSAVTNLEESIVYDKDTQRTYYRFSSY